MYLQNKPSDKKRVGSEKRGKKCFSFLLNLWRPHKNEKEDCSITQDESVDEEDKVDDEDFQDDREIWEVTHVCV